jgi:hypothetical protein
MSDNQHRTINHNIKFDKSTKFILAVIAIGVLANAFGPSLSIERAFAEISNRDTFFLEHTIKGPNPYASGGGAIEIILK